MTVEAKVKWMCAARVTCAVCALMGCSGAHHAIPPETSSVTPEETAPEVEKAAESSDVRVRNGDLIDSAEASRRAVQYMLDLTRDGRLPDSIRQVPRCEGACIDIDSGQRVSACDIWECRFSFSDPGVGVPSYGVMVMVDTAGRPSSPINIAGCLNSDHGCEMMLGYNAAIRRLGADRMSLRIEWDQEVQAFFWVNIDSGRRVSCHDRGEQKRRSSAI